MSAPDLVLPREAAKRLTCSIKTLRAYVEAGELPFVPIGLGTIRRHYAFDPADLDAFVQRRKTMKVRVNACPSTARKARRTTTSTSSAEVVDFAALRAALKKPTRVG